MDIKRITGLVGILVLAACSGTAPAPNTQGLSITNIKVEQRGRNEDNRPEMMGICKGFYLSDAQVHDFFDHSSYIREQDPSARYNILPCYANGTATINGKAYQWVIRAGGVGEFYNESDRFIKICGKQCCSKLPSIC